MSFDDRLVFNATLFRAIYKKKHESEIYQFGAATETVVNNAAKATINGLEVETQLAVTENVQLRATVGMIDGNFGQPDPLGLGRNEFPARGELDLTLIWERAPFKVAGYVKDVFHDDNYLATSVDVGVFWFGAVAVGRTWGIELTHEL